MLTDRVDNEEKTVRWEVYGSHRGTVHAHGVHPQSTAIDIGFYYFQFLCSSSYVCAHEVHVYRHRPQVITFVCLERGNRIVLRVHWRDSRIRHSGWVLILPTESAVASSYYDGRTILSYSLLRCSLSGRPIPRSVTMRADAHARTGVPPPRVRRIG
jgi:hypothetical protein